MTTMSAREFNQDVSAAKRAATREPVIITDRGEPSYVLLSIEEFRRLTGEERGIVDWLSMADDIDLEVEPLDLKLTTPTL
jgi:antitoxin (DNA-binding transcriptional repressor) of toxin-antitoxin stability system